MTRKAFLLRIDPSLLDDLKKWAEHDLRSLNGQIEYLLRESLVQAQRSGVLVPDKNNDDN